MEDKKNAMRLDDEQLEQVTGGWTECPTYQGVLRAKNDGDPEISRLADNTFRDFCLNNRGVFNCNNCPVANEWRF